MGERESPLEDFEKSLKRLKESGLADKVGTATGAVAAVVFNSLNWGEKGVRTALEMIFEEGYPDLIDILSRLNGDGGSVTKYLDENPEVLEDLKRRIKLSVSEENPVPPESPDQKS